MRLSVRSYILVTMLFLRCGSKFYPDHLFSSLKTLVFLWSVRVASEFAKYRYRGSVSKMLHNIHHKNLLWGSSSLASRTGKRLLSWGVVMHESVRTTDSEQNSGVGCRKSFRRWAEDFRVEHHAHAEFEDDWCFEGWWVGYCSKNRGRLRGKLYLDVKAQNHHKITKVLTLKLPIRNRLHDLEACHIMPNHILGQTCPF